MRAETSLTVLALAFAASCTTPPPVAPPAPPPPANAPEKPVVAPPAPPPPPADVADLGTEALAEVEHEPTPPPAEARATIEGRVVDAEGRPVPGVAVTLSRPTLAQDPRASLELDTSALARVGPRTVTFRTLHWQQAIVGRLADLGVATTDAAGRFAIAAPLGGRRVVLTAVLAEGNQVAVGSALRADTTQDAEPPCEIALRPRARLVVAASIEGRPRARSRVTLTWPNEHGQAPLAAIVLATDATGRASHWIPPGPVHVRIDDVATGAEPRRASFRRFVELGAAGAHVEAALGPAAAIAGGVVETTGAAVARARVVARDGGTAPTWAAAARAPGLLAAASVETDALGGWVLDGLEPGRRYAVTFDPPAGVRELGPAERELVAPARGVVARLVRSGPLRVALTFTTPRLSGVSSDPAGALERYVVRFERRDEASGRFRAERLAAPERRFARDELVWLWPRPGTWRVVVLSGLRTEVASPPVTLAGGEGEVAIPVELEPGRALAGRVVDARGAPVAGAVVHCDQNGRQEGTLRFADRAVRAGTWVATDGQGRFVLPDVPLDAARLVAWKVGRQELGDATRDVAAGVHSAGEMALPGSQ